MVLPISDSTHFSFACESQHIAYTCDGEIRHMRDACQDKRRVAQKSEWWQGIVAFTAYLEELSQTTGGADH